MEQLSRYEYDNSIICFFCMCVCMCVCVFLFKLHFVWMCSIRKLDIYLYSNSIIGWFAFLIRFIPFQSIIFLFLSFENYFIILFILLSLYFLSSTKEILPVLHYFVNQIFLLFINQISCVLFYILKQLKQVISASVYGLLAESSSDLSRHIVRQRR